MNNKNNDDEEGSADDTALRDKLSANGFKPDSSGMQWMSARPKILVAGAYKVIRTAAEKARKLTERGRG